MAITVNAAAAPATEGNNVTSVTTPTGWNSQASGSQFVVGYGSQGGSSSDASPAVTDNKSNTFTKEVGGNANVAGIALSTNASPAGGTNHQFTYTRTSLGFIAVVGLEVTGGLSQTTDGSNLGTFTAVSSFNIPSITTTNASDLIVAVGANGASAAETQSFSAVTGGGTYTVPTNGKDDDGTGWPIALGYQIVSSAATYQVQYAMASANSGGAAVLAIKAAASGGTPSSTDSATLTDTVNQIGVGGVADSGTLGESSKIGLGASDTASLAEQQAIALLNTDAAAFAEQVAIAVSTATSDTGQVGDQAAVAASTASADTAALAEQIKIALTAVDSAQLGEAMAIALASSDTAQLQELVSVALAIADAASLSTETLTVQQNGGNTPSSSDSATLTDAQLAVAARVAASDIGTLAEQAAIALQATDVAAMTEQIGLGLIAADSAALTEQLRVAITASVTDSAALADVQLAVNAALSAADAATLGESVAVQVFGGGLRDWVYAISQPTLKWSVSEPSGKWSVGPPIQ